MKAISSTCFVLCAVAILAACQSDVVIDKQLPLAGTQWQAEFIGMEKVEVPQGGRAITMRIGETGVSGFAGCNRYSGGLSQDGPALDFGAMGSTRVACPMGDMEFNFFTALSQAKRFTNHEGSLTLFSDDIEPLIKFRQIE